MSPYDISKGLYVIITQKKEKRKERVDQFVISGFPAGMTCRIEIIMIE